MQKYKQCEYITLNTDNSLLYFDTNIKITSRLRYRAKINIHRTTYASLFGYYVYNAYDSMWFRLPPNWSKVESIMYSTSSPTFPVTLNTVFEFECGNNYIESDGVRNEQPVVSFADKDVNFLIGNQNSTAKAINCDYYYVQIFDGETLIADYIPVLDSQNNVALYDKVNDTFVYPNQTTGISYVMQRTINVIKQPNKPLQVTMIKSSNWDKTIAIDFDGAEVEFQGQNLNEHPYRNNSKLTKLTNATITNDNVLLIFGNNSAMQTLDNITFTATEGAYMFENSKELQSANIKCDNITSSSSGWLKGCSKLTDVTLSAKGLIDPNNTNASSDGMFYGDSQLRNINADFRSITKGTNIFNGCSSLQHVELIVSESNSGWTQSNFSIPSSAPCQAYRSVDVLGDGLVRLIFTDKAYKTIDYTPYILNKGGEYHLSGVAEQVIIGTSQEDAEYYVVLVNDNDYDVIIHGNNTDTTGETLTLEPHQTWTGTIYVWWTRFGEGWFLGFESGEKPITGHIAVTTKYDVPISLPNRQVGDYYTADFRLDAITTDAEGNGNIVFNGTTSGAEWRLCRWNDGRSYYNIGGSMNYQVKQYLPDGERITRTCGNNFIKDENGEILWEGTPQSSVNFLNFAVRFCKVSVWDFKYYSKDDVLLMHLVPNPSGGFKDLVTGQVVGEGLSNLTFIED